MTRLRRALLLVCPLAALWAVAIALTGGFSVGHDWIRLSSRDPWNPTVIALVSGLALWVLAGPEPWRRTREDLLWWIGLGGAALAAVRRRSRPLSWVPAVAVAFAGGGLLIYRWAGARPLWLDEEMIALNLRDRALGDLVGPLWLGQTAPFGWLALQRAVVQALGTDEHVLRLAPAIFGIGTLAVAIWTGRRWMGPAGTFVLVLLCASGLWVSHYTLELKPYAGDIFWSFLLPTLAVWVTEARDARLETRRMVIWWAAAALGQWIAFGALMVTPASALVLFAVLWRRRGWRTALTFAWLGVVWLALFGLHYMMSVRHTTGSAYLHGYWSYAMPPPSAGWSGTVSWFAGQLQPFASKPGGTGLWMTFWLAAAGGFALSTSRILGVILAAVPLSACVLATLRLVPLFERLSLWVVPALYIGIALFIDAAVRSGRDAYGRRHWLRAALALAATVLGAQLCIDVVRHGREILEAARFTDSNHSLDDRSAVRWLMRLRQPGEALMTTRLALPAVWWYGNIPVESAGDGHPDGSLILEVGYRPPGPDCQPGALRSALAGHSRVAVYFGFRFDDVPSGFDELLLNSLAEIGVITAIRDFAGRSRAAVVDLGLPPSRNRLVHTRAGAAGDAVDDVPRLEGCVSVRPARRW